MGNKKPSITTIFLSRLFTLSAISIFFFGYFMINSHYNQFKKETDQLRTSYINEQKRMIKTEVEKVIDYINYRKSQSKEVLREQIKVRTDEAVKIARHIIESSPNLKTAKSAILTALTPIRYSNGQGYYFIIDTSGVSTLSPSGLTNKNIFHLKDVHGYPLVQETIKIGQENGEGYIQYMWNKVGNPDAAELKTTFVKMVPELDWIFGTGLYESDMKAEIEEDIFKFISKIRFGKNHDNYIFVLNFDGLELVNDSQPHLVGKNLYHLEDAKGFKVIQREIEIATTEPDGDFMKYWWNKPSTGKPSAKMSFIKGIKEWRWFAGAGIYLDDVEEIIANRELLYKKRIKGLVITNIIVLLFLLILSVFLSRFLSLRLKRNFAEFGSFYKKAANEFVAIDKQKLSFLEFVDLADDMNQMIDDHHKAEEELSYLRNYLSNIIDSMPSVLIGVDTHGNIRQWNSEAHRVTGISPDAAAGLPLEQAFPRLSTEIEQMKEAISMQQVRFERRQVRKEEGQARYEDVTIYPLVANGVEGAVIRVDDVTDRVRMEELMVQSEKMLSVGGLAAGMAHEINNPLAGMLQTANVMKSRLQDLEMPANLRAAEEIGISVDEIRAFMGKRSILRMVDTINESGLRVAEIVDNMLSFARKTDSEVFSHNPVQLMDQILELASTDYDLKKGYDFKTIKIIKEYEDNLPMVPCERAKIQQVLLNILHNGAQVMQKGRSDKGDEPCFILRLSTEKELNMLSMEIKDNGPGMDEYTRKRIFEPFFTTKPVGIGTGLGLSVSYFIITENHGGTMNVVSEPGKGATFIIHLPLGKKDDVI